MHQKIISQHIFYRRCNCRSCSFSGVSGLVGSPLHDPCTIAWLLKPELFTSVERWVGVETQGKYTQGMTVVDYWLALSEAGSAVNFSIVTDKQRLCGIYSRITAPKSRYD